MNNTNGVTSSDKWISLNVDHKNEVNTEDNAASEGKSFLNLERLTKVVLPLMSASTLFPFLSSAKKQFVNKENISFVSEQELQQGISISEEIVSKIQTCMKNILDRREEGGIKFYNSQENHRVFALDIAPGLIFKMQAYKNYIDDHLKSMKARYQKMIDAQTIIRTHQLSLLVIPNAKLFTVNFEGEEYVIIAEKKVDINPHESAQEQYFQDYAISLNEAIRQLAIFICKTGYSDVEWRNNPVLNNSLDENGNRKIALLDIEKMDSPEIGLFGGLKRRGLVRCVTEEQGKIVEEVAKQNGIKMSFFADAYANRKNEIEEGRKLKEYYSAKNITVGNESIQIDENLIDFSEYPEKEQELKKLTKELVQTINLKIATSSEESIKGRRYIHINVRTEPFKGLNNTLIDPGENEYITANAFKTDEDYYNATYLGYIVKKLIELGTLYEIVKRNSHGYFLQG